MSSNLRSPDTFDSETKKEKFLAARALSSNEVMLLLCLLALLCATELQNPAADHHDEIPSKILEIFANQNVNISSNLDGACPELSERG